MSQTVFFDLYDANDKTVGVVKDHVKEVVAHGTGARIYFVMDGYSTVKQSVAEVNQKLGNGAVKIVLTEKTTGKTVELFAKYVTRMSDNWDNNGGTFVRAHGHSQEYYVVSESSATIAQMISGA